MRFASAVLAALLVSFAAPVSAQRLQMTASVSVPGTATSAALRQTGSQTVVDLSAAKPYVVNMDASQNAMCELWKNGELFSTVTPSWHSSEIKPGSVLYPEPGKKVVLKFVCANQQGNRTEQTITLQRS